MKNTRTAAAICGLVAINGRRRRLGGHSPVGLRIACLLWTLHCLTCSNFTQAEPPEIVELFDGESFDGWEGNLDWFRIQDGAIVAGSLEREILRNEFLCTEQEYGDFELRLKFKVLGEGANAGVQVRSRRVPDHHEVSGYQADLGDGWWGCLYDESRRNRVLARPEPEELRKALHPDDWNQYVIRCEGERIRLWINDVQTVDYTEEDQSIEQRGVIGLQIHGGPPSEAWYKEITLELLAPERSPER